ncbi:hypothetical protein ACEQPO_14695 [Bacillus sp. SL00103]
MGMERIVPTMEERCSLVFCAEGSRSEINELHFCRRTKGEEEVDGPEEFHLVIVDVGGPIY